MQEITQFLVTSMGNPLFQKKPPVPHGPVKRPPPKKQETNNSANPLNQPSQRMNAEIALKRKEEKNSKDLSTDNDREKKKEKEYMKKNVSGTVLPFKEFHPDEDANRLASFFSH